MPVLSARRQLRQCLACGLILSAIGRGVHQTFEYLIPCSAVVPMSEKGIYTPFKVRTLLLLELHISIPKVREDTKIRMYLNEVTPWSKESV